VFRTTVICSIKPQPQEHRPSQGLKAVLTRREFVANSENNFPIGRSFKVVRSLFASVVAIAVFSAGGAATAAPLSRAALAQVDRVAGAWVAAGHTPGLTIGVMQDGKVVFVKGYGQAQLENRTPIQPETVFRIGSVSKQFTAAAVLKLVEEGRLSLDDRLSKYYPDFPRGDEVTIRQMLNHTSGIHNYIEVSGPRELMPLMTDYNYTTDEWIRHIVEQKPLYDFAPGSAYHYSNAGYFLSAAIVEKVSGQAFGDYLKDHVFKPAGLTSTAVDTDGPIVPLRASGYEVVRKGAKGYRTANYVTMSVTSGAGGLRSTASDLLKWQDALLSGRVVAPGLVKQMLEPGRLSDGRLASSAPFPTPNANAPAQRDYGLGIEVDAVAGHRRVSHGGNIYGFNAALDSYPDDGVAWVALSNAGTGVSGLSREIEAALLGVPASGKDASPD
jgi:CubicO group peptidase (beta-lactamase class C family)